MQSVKKQENPIPIIDQKMGLCVGVNNMKNNLEPTANLAFPCETCGTKRAYVVEGAKGQTLRCEKGHWLESLRQEPKEWNDWMEDRI